MYELLEEDKSDLLEKYDVTKRVITRITNFFSTCNFIKTYSQFLYLCEAACYRYQSDKITNDVLHSQGDNGYIISIKDVLIDAINEVYEEPDDMSYEDKKELETCKKMLLQPKKRHI